MNAWQYGALAALVAGLAWLIVRYSLFVPATRGLPILMYHQVSRDRRDPLTVTVDQFASQLDYLAAEGYRSITCRELIAHLDHGAALPDRGVLLTFDDGYLNNLELAYPLLKGADFGPRSFCQWHGWVEPTLGTTAPSRSPAPRNWRRSIRR